MIVGQQKRRELACNWIKIGCKYYSIIIEDIPGTGPAIGASIRRTKGCKRMSGYFLNSGYWIMYWIIPKSWLETVEIFNQPSLGVLYLAPPFQETSVFQLSA